MKAAGYIAIAGGTLLFLGGALGWGIFALIYKFIEGYLNLAGEYAGYVKIVFQVLIFLANLGGITVIIGGWAILRGLERLGKILIIIGLGTGILTLIVQALIAYGTGTWDGWTLFMMSFTGIGTILTLVAKWLA